MVESKLSRSFKITVKTAKEIYEEELLKQEHLSRFNMNPNDIKTVSVNYAVPGYLYEELGVASLAHSCAGSACAVFQDPYGHQCSIDYIAYYDSNPHKTHAGGQPHWNSEIRYVKDGNIIGKIKEVTAHIMEDTPEIEIISNCEGSVNRQKVLRDQPVKKQH